MTFLRRVVILGILCSSLNKYYYSECFSFHHEGKSDNYSSTIDRKAEVESNTKLEEHVEKVKYSTLDLDSELVMSRNPSPSEGQQQVRPFLHSQVEMLIDYLFHKPMFMGKTSTTSGPIELEAPDESCECGLAAVTPNTENRIEGGNIAQPGEFPWRVYLESAEGVLKIRCAGTLINSNWILTAASCISPFATFIIIFMGDYDENSQSETSIISISSFWIKHSSYSAFNHENDIALVRLETPVQFNKMIQPVCLPILNKYASFIGATVTATSWEFKNGDSSSAKLRRVDLPYLAGYQCKNIMTKLQLPYPNVTGSMSCTFKKDARLCYDDFGGSLDYFDTDKNTYYAIGIPITARYGICENIFYPQIATNIMAYVDWIKATAAGEKFCVR